MKTVLSLIFTVIALVQCADAQQMNGRYRGNLQPVRITPATFAALMPVPYIDWSVKENGRVGSLRENDTGVRVRLVRRNVGRGYFFVGTFGPANFSLKDGSLCSASQSYYIGPVPGNVALVQVTGIQVCPIGTMTYHYTGRFSKKK